MSVNGSNNFLNIEDANLRVRNGSVHAQGMTIGGAIVSASHGLQSVSDTGNTTSNTLQFTNATTAFKATSNIELTANTAIVVESNVLMDFKTLGQIEFPGPLTLGQSLDVPRISRYDVDTETPRPEKLVVDFDTTVNSSPTDISGKGNHGTLVGATYSPADKAFTFDGTDQYIKFDTGLTGNAIFSVSMWFISTGAGVDTLFQINGDYTGTSGEIAWLYKSGNELFFDFINNNLKVDYSVFNNNDWNHVVVTFDGNATTGRCIYANGVKLTGTLDGSSSGTALSLTNNTQAVIGALHRTSQNDYIHEIVGKISNFKLYSVALEPSEVQKLYRLGRTGRSMVISDTAVGIGKAPEAQLDVRGVLKCDKLFVGDEVMSSPVTIAFSTYWSPNIGDGSTTGTYTPTHTYYNYGNGFDTSNGRFTAPINGVYHIDWNSYTNNGSATTNSKIILYKNGTAFITKGPTMFKHGQNLTATLYLAANEYIHIGGGGATNPAYPLYYYGNTGMMAHYSGYLVSAT
jgi:hypothetical protein